MLGSKLSEKCYILRILKVTGTDERGTAVRSDALESALLGDLDPERDKAALLLRLEGLLSNEVDLRTTELIGSIPIKARATLFHSTPAGGSVFLDDQSIQTLQRNVELLGKTGGAQRRDNQPPNPERYTPPLFMVDEPCFGFSVAAVTSGENHFTRSHISAELRRL